MHYSKNYMNAIRAANFSNDHESVITSMKENIADHKSAISKVEKMISDCKDPAKCEKLKKDLDRHKQNLERHEKKLKEYEEKVTVGNFSISHEERAQIMSDRDKIRSEVASYN